MIRGEYFIGNVWWQWLSKGYENSNLLASGFAICWINLPQPSGCDLALYIIPRCDIVCYRADKWVECRAHCWWWGLEARWRLEDWGQETMSVWAWIFAFKCSLWKPKPPSLTLAWTRKIRTMYHERLWHYNIPFKTKKEDGEKKKSTRCYKSVYSIYRIPWETYGFTSYRNNSKFRDTWKYSFSLATITYRKSLGIRRIRSRIGWRSRVKEETKEL